MYLLTFQAKYGSSINIYHNMCIMYVPRTSFLPIFHDFRRSEIVLTKTLPEKEEHVIPVKMSPIQLSLYQTFVKSVKNYGYVNPITAFTICIKVILNIMHYENV